MNHNQQEICPFLLKYKWCHSYEHFQNRNHSQHPPKNILCPNIVKHGSCRDSNCPYQHVNPKNKYYYKIVQNVDPFNSLEKRKRKNCFYLCELPMKDEACRYYSNSEKCLNLNCLFQHHTKKNFVRKDPYDYNIWNQKPEKTFNEKKICPFLLETGYCRMQNVRDYSGNDKRLTCKFNHDFAPDRKIANPGAKLEDLGSDHPIFKEIEKKFKYNWNFGSVPNVIKIERITNPYLNYWFSQFQSYIKTKRSKTFIAESLYHGTNEEDLNRIMHSGFYIVSNYNASPNCLNSGYKSNNQNKPSLCDKTCRYCTEKHRWNYCHMYGLGIYLTLCSSKSDKYVQSQGNYKKLLQCDVLLGESFYHEEDLRKPDAAHDWVLPPNGYDSITVPGNTKSSNSNNQKTNVLNNEFIIFHKFQAIPCYLITYK